MAARCSRHSARYSSASCVLKIDHLFVLLTEMPLPTLRFPASALKRSNSLTARGRSSPQRSNRPSAPARSMARASPCRPSAATVAAAPLSACACSRTPGAVRFLDPPAQIVQLRGNILEEAFEDDARQLPVSHQPSATEPPHRKSRSTVPAEALAQEMPRCGQPSGKHLRQARRFNRLGKIIVHPFAQTSVPVGRHRVGRESDDRNARMNRTADKAGGFEAVHHRHLAVHQHQVVASAAGPLQRPRRRW